MNEKNKKRIIKFQKDIDYKFKNQGLLLQALTTPQYGNENNLPHYEILETLGDAVIKLIFSLKIYRSGETDPGELTKIKQGLENNQTFLEVAEEMKLENYIFTSKLQKVEGTSILADIFEAICGAIYIDSDNNLLVVETKIIDRFVKDWDKFLEKPLNFSKNLLIEFLQEKLKFTPLIKYNYENIGPQHELQWRALSPRILDQNSKDVVFLPTSLKSELFKAKREAEKDLSLKILNFIKENKFFDSS